MKSICYVQYILAGGPQVCKLNFMLIVYKYASGFQS